MGARFANASSQYLINSSPPVVQFPMAVAMWVNFDAVATTRNLWSLADPAVANHFYSLDTDTSGFNIAAAAGGPTNTASIAVVPTTGASNWFFVLLRIIDFNNRRLELLSPTGAASSVGSGTGRTAICTTAYIGARGGSTILNYFDGTIGEYWLTSGDVVSNPALMDVADLRQLARAGPWSFPHLAQSVVDYRSFRNGIDSDEDYGLDYFNGPKGRQNWVNTNGVIRGANPPLNDGVYRRPGDFIRPGIV